MQQIAFLANPKEASTEKKGVKMFLASLTLQTLASVASVKSTSETDLK